MLYIRITTECKFMCIYIYSYVIISSSISSSSIIGSLISSVGVVSGAVTTIMDDYSTYIYIYYEGTWRRSCFESVKRVRFPGPQEAMLTSCALAACHLYNAYVRKLFCVHLGRSVWRALAAVHPVRTLWNILYGQSAKRDVIPS